MTKYLCPVIIAILLQPAPTLALIAKHTFTFQKRLQRSITQQRVHDLVSGHLSLHPQLKLSTVFIEQASHVSCTAAIEQACASAQTIWLAEWIQLDYKRNCRLSRGTIREHCHPVPPSFSTSTATSSAYSAGWTVSRSLMLTNSSLMRRHTRLARPCSSGKKHLQKY